MAEKRLGMSDQNRQKESGEEWIRLPKPRERCLTTGLSRTSLVELLDERDPETGDLLILQHVKKRSGKQRGIRMINKASLLAFLKTNAEKQGRLQFSPDVSNPQNLSVQEVCVDYETFLQFSDPDSTLSEEGWPRMTFAEKVQILKDLGRIK
jgi:hypothetical protein